MKAESVQRVIKLVERGLVLADRYLAIREEELRAQKPVSPFTVHTGTTGNGTPFAPTRINGRCTSCGVGEGVVHLPHCSFVHS